MSSGPYMEPECMVRWSVSVPYDHVASTLHCKSKALGDAKSEDIASFCNADLHLTRDHDLDWKRARRYEFDHSPVFTF
jgi:hypothetical protein